MKNLGTGMGRKYMGNVWRQNFNWMSGCHEGGVGSYSRSPDGPDWGRSCMSFCLAKDSPFDRKSVGRGDVDCYPGGDVLEVSLGRWK